MKKLLKEEHSGYIITFEVLATLYMLTMFIVMTLYILRVMNVQRYMNTVMTSTAAEASRWGGVNTKAYSVNVSTTPLLVTAQKELDYLCLDFHAIIKGSPDKIIYDDHDININITYSLPSVLGPLTFESMSKVTDLTGDQNDMYNVTRYMHMSVDVKSIMSSGRLL